MSYVPELPPTMDKENPGAVSKPRYKTLSSKNAANPLGIPPRSALGNLSANMTLGEARSENGGSKPPPDSIRTFGSSLGKNSNVPMSKSSLALPTGFGQLSTTNHSQGRSNMKPAPPQSSLSIPPSINFKGSDPLSRLIQETEARNTATKHEQEKRFTSLTGASSSTSSAPTLSLSGSFKKKSLVNSEMLLEPMQSYMVTQPRLKGQVRAGAINSSMLSNTGNNNLNASFISTGSANEMKKRSFQEELERAKQAALKKEQEEREMRQKQQELERQQAEITAEEAKRIAEIEAEKAMREEQERLEEEARALRRKQQRDEEVKRKSADLVSRARELEAAGKTAAALALFKEASSYLPDNEKLKARVEKLREQLRGALDEEDDHQQQKEEEDDPLAALTKANKQRSDSPGAEELSDPLHLTKNQEMLRPQPTVEERETFLVRLGRAVLSEGNQKVMNGLIQLTKAMMEMEKIQLEDQRADGVDLSSSSNANRKVRFFTMDAAIGPPPQEPFLLTSEAFESSLFPVDRMVDVLSQMVKTSDEIRKAAGKSFDWRSALGSFHQIVTSLQGEDLSCKSAQYMNCLMHFAIGQSTCSCVSSRTNAFTHCHYGAVSPRDLLGKILSMGLRGCLRRVLNDPKAQLYLLGSYKYACGDVAAVAHQALLLFETRQQVVDSIVLIGKKASSASSEIARVGEFVEAHKFLSSLFPSEQVCVNMTDGDSVSWAKIRKYLSVAREFKCDDELVLASLAALPALVKKLQEHTTVVTAARSHVDLALRNAMKDDACNCEGSRRRRAANLGTWIAPELSRNCGSQKSQGQRDCGKCSKGLAEKDEQIACECCEKRFHLKCVGLPSGYEKDFICSKCVPKVKKQPSKCADGEEEEDRE